MATSDLLMGKSVMITGGASGIGRATAELVAAQGGAVTVADIDENGGREVAEKITANGGQAQFQRCDVANAAEVEATVAATVKAFGSLDGAFNNAAIGGRIANIVDSDPADWDRMIAVALTGVYNCLRSQLPIMIKQRSGSIVNTSSVLGLGGVVGSSAYTAAKHGVLGLTKAAALETATLGVRVNAVCPGYIETPMLINGLGATRGDAVWKATEALHPMERLGQASEIADAVVWLLSDHSTFVTGHPLPVDGGYSAR